jgi:hypothetical protein
MRRVLTAAGVAVLIGLAGCSKPAPEAAAPAAPSPPKGEGRQQQFYAGQDQIESVESGAISVTKDGLSMTAKGVAAGPGYINAGFMRRIYAAQPKDGIYEMDVVADKPAAAGAAAPTPIEVKGAWDAYPKDRLKGIRFMTKTNTVVAMLPAS